MTGEAPSFRGVNMRLPQLAAALAILGIAACDSATSPGPSSADLDGRWGGAWNGNPGGSSLNLTLSTAGSSVSGSGQKCGVGALCSPGTVTVRGSHQSRFGPFSLVLTGAGGFVATYTGGFAGPDQIRGTWTERGASYTAVLNRCSPTTFCW